MSTPDPSAAVRGPGAVPVLLSLLLLALFAPVVLAVGSEAFRPVWLKNLAAGVPISVLWGVGSIALFVVLTWLFARMTFAQLQPTEGE